MRQDIHTIEDIKILVDTFYSKVQIDELIGGIFMGTIRDWPTHLEKMYRFWSTILLDAQTYRGQPFLPHSSMPVEQKHFDRWLGYWHETVDEFFSGNVAEEAKFRGALMSRIFLSKIKQIQNKEWETLGLK
ncbi:MAG TPA: group III truncated hemoglobin [Edaphocola sp.]|nr:group III truncated hemoglobin [Edaphocola sp.]